MKGAAVAEPSVGHGVGGSAEFAKNVRSIWVSLFDKEDAVLVSLFDSWKPPSATTRADPVDENRGPRPRARFFAKTHLSKRGKTCDFQSAYPLAYKEWLWDDGLSHWAP